MKRQIAQPEFRRVHESPKDQAELVATAVHGLVRAVEKLLIEHGRGVIERQFHHERPVSAATDIFLSTATLSRATSATRRAGSVDQAAADLDNARIFITMTGEPAADAGLPA